MSLKSPLCPSRMEGAGVSSRPFSPVPCGWLRMVPWLPESKEAPPLLGSREADGSGEATGQHFWSSVVEQTRTWRTHSLVSRVPVTLQ